ncbi:Glucose N-acetyltransferase, partial [Lachnellula suecica]
MSTPQNLQRTRRRTPTIGQDSEIPDFLQNSPFIPISTGHDSYSFTHHVQPAIPKPTLGQILRSKWMRNVFTTFLLFLMFLYLRGQAHKHNMMTHLGLAGPKCLLNEPVAVPETVPAGVDWRRFAYVQYVTNPDYLCNSVMIFEALHRLGSKAGRLLMYPSTYSLDRSSAMEGALLLKARDEYNVTLVPIDLLSKKFNYQLWASSYTKLLVFNQTSYSRLLVLDSDATLLAPLDELFFVPSARAAMPKAYWLEKPLLSSHIMLVEPSAAEFARVEKAISKAEQGTYDMEIMNSLYGSDCVVLPHRKYALLTGEFRKTEHEAYLGPGVKWDAGVVRAETKYIHFSDNPLPKPWVEPNTYELQGTRPLCEPEADGKVDCRGRDF